MAEKQDPDNGVSFTVTVDGNNEDDDWDRSGVQGHFITDT